MFADLKPYPGQANASMPSHWTPLRLGAVGRLFKGNGGSKDDDAESGVPCIRYGDLYTRYNIAIRRAAWCVNPDRASAYTKLQYGDVLFAASGETIEDIATAAVNLISEPNVLCGGDLVILRPTMAVEPVFLSFAVNTPSARLHKAGHATGTMIVHIDAGALKNIRLALPPRAEQTAITRYLVHANARIDRAIAAKRKMIDLLEEQEQAVINHAVTRGTGTSVQLRDSGIPSYGSVPHHWDVRRLGTLISSGPRNGVSPPVDETGDLESLSISVVRNGLVDVQPADIKYVDRSAVGSVSDYELRSGDVLVVRGNGNIHLVGRAGLVVEDMPGGIYPDLLMRIRLSRTADPAFVVVAFGVPAVRRQIELAARTAVGTYKVSGPDLRRLQIAVPPLREQEAIVNHIASETETANAVVARTSREIELLRQFKARLTADVVTGQIDVREIASTLPDVDPVKAAESVGAGMDDELEEVAGEALERAEP